MLNVIQQTLTYSATINRGKERVAAAHSINHYKLLQSILMFVRFINSALRTGGRSGYLSNLVECNGILIFQIEVKGENGGG